MCAVEIGWVFDNSMLKVCRRKRAMQASMTPTAGFRPRIAEMAHRDPRAGLREPVL
jgi:hypothetical protein